MVQIIEENRRPSTSDRFAQAFSNLGQSSGQLIPEYLMQKEQQQSQMQQMQQVNEAYKRLTGEDLSGLPPQAQQQIAQLLLQGQQKQSEIGQQLAGKQQENQLKSDENLKKEQEKLAPLYSALDTIDQMRKIRKKNNLGFGSSITGLLSADTRRDRGEYSQLGKSLIQLASNIPIRNKLEFETLAEKLHDASLTDAEAEGVLNAMERIIRGSLSNSDSGNEMQGMSNSVGKKSERRPLNSFIGKK